MDAIQIAQEKFAELIRSEFERIERMKADNEITDFSKLDEIVVGVLPGDGIGPIIMEQALRVLKDLMAPEIESGRLKIKEIEGMTIGDFKGPHGNPQGFRPMAQPDFCQQPSAPGTGAVRGGASHQDSGEGHRLDFLP